MHRRLQLALVILFVGCVAFAQSAQVLDSVLAVVNSAPIFQSDWEMALRCEALMSGRSVESFNEEERRAVFNRLVDQELLRQQMRGFELGTLTDQDIQTKISEVRAQLAGAAKDEDWKNMLERYGIMEADVSDRVRAQLEVERFLEYRLRPLVRVDYRTITRYYREQFLPEVKKKGGKEVPLSEVSERIREILTQQKMGEQTALWLQTLREGADIRFTNTSAASPAEVEVTQSK
jgi:hypothetical protein